MRHRIHVRINAGGTLAEHRRHHRHQRRDQALVARDAEQCHHRIRCPRRKPQPDDGQHHAGHFHLGASACILRAPSEPLLVTLLGQRLHAPRLADGSQNVHVTERDAGKRYRPGAHEEHEHEYASGSIAVQIVETAAGQIALGHVATEADVQSGHNGKRNAVQPHQADEQTGADFGDVAQRIERMHDHEVAIDRDGRQGGNGRDARQAADETVEATT